MALMTIVIWSFSFLFIVQLNRELTPIGVVVGRMDVFLLVLLAALIWRRPSLRGRSARQWCVVVALSLVGGPLYHNVFSWSAGTNASGVSRIDPALLGLILATVPVHTGWMARVFLGERLTTAKIIALTLGLGGVAIVIAGRHGRIDLWPASNLEGPIGATVAAVLGAGIAVLMRAARTIYGPLDLMIVAGLLMVFWNALLHPWADLGRVADMSAAGWVALIVLGVFGLGVASVTWAAALSGLPAVTCAMYLFVACVLAAFWGWLFDGKPIGWPFVAGAALVLTGLVVMTRRPAPPAIPAPIAPCPRAPDGP
jgi:drug/metabolite transporter (DMT)-like permease